MGVHDHKMEAKNEIEKVTAAVVTVSDSRTEKTDLSGKIIVELLQQDGHQVVATSLIPNDSQFIEEKLFELSGQRIQCIVFTGGTGLSPRDVTLDAVRRHFDKTLTGFGELFRFLSFQEIGSAAMLSRAEAGIVGCSLVVSLPGSPNAVRLALEKLIIPELRHIVSQLSRH